MEVLSNDADEAPNPQADKDSEDNEIDDSNEESTPTDPEKKERGKREPPPTLEQVQAAMEDLEKLLYSPRHDA